MQVTSFRWSIGLIVIALVSLAALATTRTASAALPDIDPTSCGGTSAPNAYCSFFDDGTDVVIGPNSCNVVGSCESIGNNVRINVGALPLVGSCNGPDACAGLGTSADGKVEVGHGSCNAEFACPGVGTDAFVDSAIGHGACNAYSACNGLGTLGTFDVGSGSCNGVMACSGAGVIGAFMTGPGSCNGPNACTGNGNNGNFNAGAGSCNDDGACVSGNFPTVGTVGDFSCNQYNNPPGSGTYAEECTGGVDVCAAGEISFCSTEIAVSGQVDVGNCMYNDPAISLAIVCAVTGAPGFGSLAGVLQSILSMFAFF